MKTKDRIIQLKQSGIRNCQIAARLNVSKQYVSYVCRTMHNKRTKDKTTSTSDFVRVGTASRMLGVSISTVIRWCDEGKIQAFRIKGRRRDRMLKISDLQHLGSSEFVTVSSASRMLGVSTSTVRRWCDEGKIQAFRIESRRRDRMLKISDLQHLRSSEFVT